MGQPIATLDDVQRLVRGGFNQKQATTLVQAMNFKMSNVLTREEFDSALAAQAEIFRRELAQAVQALRNEQKDFQIKVTEEISKLRTEMSEFKVQVSENISSLRVEMSEMRTDIAGIKTTIAEKQNTLILQIAGLLTIATAVIGIVISFTV